MKCEERLLQRWVEVRDVLPLSEAEVAAEVMKPGGKRSERKGGHHGGAASANAGPAAGGSFSLDARACTHTHTHTHTHTACEHVMHSVWYGGNCVVWCARAQVQGFV